METFFGVYDEKNLFIWDILMVWRFPICLNVTLFDVVLWFSKKLKGKRKTTTNQGNIWNKKILSRVHLLHNSWIAEAVGKVSYVLCTPYLQNFLELLQQCNEFSHCKSWLCLQFCFILSIVFVNCVLQSLWHKLHFENPSNIPKNFGYTLFVDSSL